MVPLFIVDAFAEKPFSGNPAAVCLLLDEERPDEWKQYLAAEMNLSETAFVTRGKDGAENIFGLRWFTPATEVNLCGHATLASAHVLWEEGIVPSSEKIMFETKSGPLEAARTADGVSLDFPAINPEPAAPPMELVEGLGTNPLTVRKAGEDFMVELASPEAVEELAPDLPVLKRLDCRGVIVTARGGEGADFVSRFFAPSAGIDEDPVTGSAHCSLGVYWSRMLGRKKLSARQLSKRGGFLKVEVKENRVILSGKAVTVLRGELEAPPGNRRAVNSP
ncbi:MAG: PhzF family phenazine biosynthesis protein [Candidatus Nitrospinota bacterium M3_3B_026]